MKKEEKIVESWNKKRVGIALCIILFLIVGVVYFLKNNFSIGKRSQQTAQTRFLSSKERFEDVVQGEFDSIKKQAMDIDVGELASSSPQIKRIIEDLKSLQDYPKNQIKEACTQICRKL